ncbi:UNVERIFIED_CONTAM: hypothetical protein Scaly_0571800 [Sesamum calycinum]|uniref:Uncharacterized protein n=1 Tax=Sesamum calycinum TaxID=2727403 RepID=A0AAW2RRM3_9LAMI
MTERGGQRWHARIETQGCGGLGSSCADCTFQFQQSVEVTASGSGHFHCLRCHVEPIICSTSYGFSSNWTKASIEPQRVSENSGLSFRNENPFFGTTRFHWLPQGHDICISQVSVAADYSDSVPDSSSYITSNGYHPLEELRDHGRVRDRMLTSAEIARTAVEGLAAIPGIVHCEPHEQISWAEFDYVIDDFGDIFFEVYDGQNILQDHGASNPVVEDISKTDIWGDWGMPENSNWTHPVYFAKCLTKSVVSVQDFQYAEPDVLVHSIPSILERFGESRTRCNSALKALCKKKGLHVEGANLIGVDSLGMDVRVSSGTEVRTHRFSFKVRATSECAADKQIQQLLFPRSRRKKLRTLDRPTDFD